jgi:hypothetical protein
MQTVRGERSPAAGTEISDRPRMAVVIILRQRYGTVTVRQDLVPGIAASSGALNRRHQTLIKEASCPQWMPFALLQRDHGPQTRRPAGARVS